MQTFAYLKNEKNFFKTKNIQVVFNATLSGIWNEFCSHFWSMVYKNSTATTTKRPT